MSHRVFRLTSCVTSTSHLQQHHSLKVSAWRPSLSPQSRSKSPLQSMDTASLFPNCFLTHPSMTLWHLHHVYSAATWPSTSTTRVATPSVAQPARSLATTAPASQESTTGTPQALQAPRPTSQVHPVTSTSPPLPSRTRLRHWHHVTFLASVRPTSASSTLTRAVACAMSLNSSK